MLSFKTISVWKVVGKNLLRIVDYEYTEGGPKKTFSAWSLERYVGGMKTYQSSVPMDELALKEHSMMKALPPCAC